MNQVSNKENKMSQEVAIVNGTEIRVIREDENLLFVAKDIVEGVGATWGSHSIDHIPDDFKLVVSVTTSFGVKDTYALTEAGLNMYLFRSDKPAALPFQRKLAEEVLPSIRKHGVYATESTVEAMLNDPDVMIKALVALKEERIAKINAQLEAKEAEKRAQEAKESEAKALEARDAAAAKEKHAMSLVGTITEAPSDENLLLREVSKKFQSLGWDCNESKLRASLVKAGVLMKGSRGITATSKAISAGLCVVGNKLGDKVVQNNMTGWSGEVLTPRFTAKGVMVVGKNLPKFGFKQETHTIEFMDLELPEE